MTPQRSKFTREFKLEAISTIINDNSKIIEVAVSLELVIQHLITR